jgi:hypothetical protein
MNVREGMRRLGITLGFLGGTAGAFAGFTHAKDLWNTRSAYKRFESLAASPAIRKERKELWEAMQKDWFTRHAPPEDRKKMASAETKGRIDGVDQFTVEPSSGRIVAIEISTGESVQRVDPPAPQAYLFPLLYPLFGFLLPWGVIRVVTWVGCGFFAENRL